MQGFLVYVFPESGKGYGTVVVATHAKFDLTFFPARRNNKRVADFFATLPARTEECRVMEDLRDEDGILEIDIDGAGKDMCTAEIVADSASSTMTQAPSTSPPLGTPLPDQTRANPFSEATDEGGQQDAVEERPPTDKLQWLDAIAWEIEKEYNAKLDGIIDMHVKDTDPNLPVRSENDNLIVPDPDELESSDDEDDATAMTHSKHTIRRNRGARTGPRRRRPSLALGHCSCQVHAPLQIPRLHQGSHSQH
jgi:hypothetical protein